MNKKIIGLSVLIILLILPVIGLAQPGQLGIPITTLIIDILNVALNVLWSIAVAFVIIMFTIAGFKYLTAQGDPSKISESNKAVIWGTVGTAVVVLAWSVIAVVRMQIGV